jgi:deoxyribonuclease-1
MKFKMKISRCLVNMLLLLCSDCIISSAQTLTVSSAQLNFGTADELNPDSIQLTIYNNMGKSVNVTNMHFYNFYGAPAFSASQNNFTISDGSSQAVWIKFAPVHNIYHNSELVIENDGNRGALSVDLLAQGHYSNAYYNATENYAEEALKTQIHTITGVNYNALTYNPGRDSMFMVLDNKKFNGQGAAVNTIECVYTGRNAVGYIDRTDCQTNDNFNTEHTFPQGLFSSLEPMKSDLHHLFPTDDNANNVRSSYPFGIVTNASWTDGGSKFDNNTNIFEPRDAHKGETARAMLYFVLRYQNYSNFLNSQEAILKTWNKSFLPSAVETTRNNTIFQWQNNRNPFVDYPQLADRITSFSTTSTAPSVNSFDKFYSSIAYGNVTPNVPAVYSYIIVNTGNQNIQLSNFNVSNSAILSITSGGSNTTLAPGESLRTDIQLLSPAGAVNEQFTFNTNVSSSLNVTVPVTANVAVAGVDEWDANAFRVYPSPFSTCFAIETNADLKNAVMEITSVEGRKISYIYNSGHICLEEKNLPDGFYILTINGNKGTYRHKLVKAGN